MNTTSTEIPISLPSQDSVPASTPSPSKKLFVIIGIIIFILILTSGAFFLGKSQNNQSNSPSPSSTSSSFSTFSPTPTPAPTADWETYTDKEYKFEIKYPKPNAEFKNQLPLKQYLDNDLSQGYRLTLSSNNIKREDFLIIIKKVESTTSLIDYWKSEQIKNGANSVECTSNQCTVYYITPDRKITYNILKEDLQGRNSIVINNPKSNYTTDTFSIYSQTILFRLNDQYIFSIYKGSAPITDQILSTFKFTDDNINSDWHTFKGFKASQTSFLPYTIKYPPNWSQTIEYTEPGITSGDSYYTLVLTKNGYAIRLFQGTFGVDRCLFDGESPPTSTDPGEPYNDYRDRQYTELNSQIGPLRRFLSDSRRKNGDRVIEFCWKNTQSGKFLSSLEMGSLSYTIPAIYDQTYILEMDSIIKTLSK